MWHIDEQRHQSGKTYSLVEMKFRRDKKNFQKKSVKVFNQKRVCAQTDACVHVSVCVHTCVQVCVCVCVCVYMCI